MIEEQAALALQIVQRAVDPKIMKFVVRFLLPIAPNIFFCMLSYQNVFYKSFAPTVNTYLAEVRR